jgi:hypothetical protein
MQRMKTKTQLSVTKRKHKLGINIAPNPWLVSYPVFDETPRYIGGADIFGETRLLAVVRKNRLVNLLLGLSAYSHTINYRALVHGIGQIEIDEVYLGVDRTGRQFVIPIQAKCGNDKQSAVQARQDILCCADKFPGLICRAISAQFMEGDLIALFELMLQDGAIKVVDEAHYRLVPADEISRDELLAYAQRKK